MAELEARVEELETTFGAIALLLWADNHEGSALQGRIARAIRLNPYLRRRRALNGLSEQTDAV